MSDLPTPHNNFFHFALSQLPNARSLIETQLDAPALAVSDLENLKLEDGSFVDADLREKFSDLLFSAPLAKNRDANGAEETLIYFLFEHKSQSDALTAFQLLSYLIRIWEKRLREGLELCPIVPLVVYHGESGWSAARSMQELVMGPKELAEYQVDFRFQLMDLNALKDHEIGGNPILKSTLRLLKYSRSRHLIEILGEILRLIVQLLPGHQGEEWVKVIGVYVMSVNKNISESEYKQTLKSVFPTQFEPGSLADRLLTQGREEGREVGLEEGREEGRVEGLERGKMAGKIQLMQELLGEEVATDDKLRNLDEISLTNLLVELQQRLRDR